MTHIKKYCFTLLAGLLLCTASVAACAAEPADFILTESKDYAEISQLSDKICDWVNGAMEEQGDTSRPITPADLDFSNAYRDDLDTDIFHQSISTEAELLAYLEQHKDYTWNIPVFTDHMTYEVTLCLGPPVEPDAGLTEEEIVQIAAEEHKWHISSVGVADGRHDDNHITDAQEILNNNKQRYDRVYIVVGESGIPYCVLALAAYQGRLTAAVPLSADMVIEDRRPRYGSAQTTDTVEITFYSGRVYSFDEMKHVMVLTKVEEAGLFSDGETGGGVIIPNPNAKPPRHPRLYIAIAAVLLLAALLYWARYKPRSTE